MEIPTTTELAPSRLPRRLVVLGIILLVAFGLRACHLTNHLAGPLGHLEEANPNTDVAAFSAWAKEIAAGDWLGRDTFHPHMDWMLDFAPPEQFEAWWGGKEIYHQSPLFPYLLGVSYKAFGSSVPLLILQVLLSCLSVFCVYDVGRRLCDVRAGLIAAGLAAAFAPAVVLDAILLRSSLNASLTVLSVWLLLLLRDRGNAGLAFGAGACLAASTLLRPTGLVLLVVGPLLLCLERPARERWKSWVPALVAGAVLIAGPFVARNAVVGAPLLEFSTRGPETLIHAHVYGADPAFMNLPRPDLFRTYMTQGHGSLKAALGTAIDTWPEQNRRSSWTWHIRQKLVCAFSDYEYSNNVNFYYYREATPLLRWLPTFGWFAGLAAIGTILLAAFGRQRAAGLIVLTAAGGLLLGALLGFTMGRYRMPLAVLLTIPAGAAFSFVVSWVGQRKPGRAGIATLGALALTLLSLWATPKYAYPDATTGAEVIQEGAVRRLREDGERLRSQEFCEAARLAYAAGDNRRATGILEAYVADYSAFLADAMRRAESLPADQRELAMKTISRRGEFFMAHVGNTLAVSGNPEGTDRLRANVLEVIRTLRVPDRSP